MKQIKEFQKGVSETHREENMFINCTAHKLTKKQSEAVRLYTEEIYELSDMEPDLYSKLLNCPSDNELIRKLLKEFSSFLLEQYIRKGNERVYLHFPIGSPYFMALFFSVFPKENRIIFLFSHSERKSIEEVQDNGSVTKKAKFEFIKFLELTRPK